uniref:helix-turn-helix transcriptional regulator n=1 Tax=uncultured Allobacillus sp. TaxID=1638025 RepID=UPI002596B3AD|nr:DNA-binding response regulator [uncultured Allobacillus sp.]
MKEKEIKYILHNYHWMIQTIALKRSELNDAGESLIAQYGLAAAMPKAQGMNSDPIYNEVERRQKAHASIEKIERKVRFIQDNMHVITDVKEKLVLNKMLDGHSLRMIARQTGMTFSMVRTHKNNIAEKLYETQGVKSNRTNRTNRTVNTN